MHKGTRISIDKQQYTSPRIKFVQFDMQDIITSSPYPPIPPGPCPPDNGRSPFCSLDD